MRGVDVAGPVQADLGIGFLLVHVVLARNADRNGAQCKRQTAVAPPAFSSYFLTFGISI